MIELLVSSQTEVDEEITVDVESETPIYKKQKEMELLTLHTAKRDTYRIKEELALPGTKETIGTILWTDISNRKLDTKLGADELLLSGELLVFCFYESPDGKMDWIEQTIPYEEDRVLRCRRVHVPSSECESGRHQCGCPHG